MSVVRLWVSLGVVVLGFVLSACGDSGNEKVFRIAGIPDQNASTLAQKYHILTDYLSQELGLTVKYVPTVNYAATVTSFNRGDIQMAWFGGLTGVQARLASPGSLALAQRPRDTEFHSKFIVQSGLDVTILEDLNGLTFTFGSESSTSGHLMPRHFLLEAGVDPETDFAGNANFSGSHDKTWALVESGAFQAGVLNEAVWDEAVEEGRVDVSRARVFFVTPSYFDYNWTVRGDLDAEFGDGFTLRVQNALVSLDGSDQDVLDLFSTDSFIESQNENYQAIEDVAKSLGIIQN
ncbi:MAG: putative selenate ABC transporter substrate-binding protein [Dehalococcoidia bacterium]|nr:putative selenate ABC transporter substrate-binding protein [Chloroflexota bacterium]MCD5399300.1 putative selenate ABC transporter substrate-binding protein [Dehalococcoidia bacterium]